MPFIAIFILNFNDGELCAINNYANAPPLVQPLWLQSLINVDEGSSDANPDVYCV